MDDSESQVTSEFEEDDWEAGSLGGASISGDEEQDDAVGEEGLDERVMGKRAPYRVLPPEELRQRQQEVVASLTSMLCISDEAAVRLLRKHKWDAHRVQEAWFSDTAAVSASVGMIDPEPAVLAPAEATCMVCFETLPAAAMEGGACGHLFCMSCWHGYVSAAIQGGPACMDLRCPIPKCGACVPWELVRRVATPADAARFDRFVLSSFVDDNPVLSWCVGTGCESAIEALADRGPSDPLDISCTSCGAQFCFACKEAAHRPVPCALVRQWLLKNSAESENAQWIIANTKQCPKCHRPIEKNHGCMHMTCSQCQFEFCWLCGGSWKEHGDRTGGYYNCNRYEAAKQRGEYDEQSRQRETAKQSLERYMHYFERWNAHQKARAKARTDMAAQVKQHLEKLADQAKTPTSQLKFITDAWEQIIECRRVLSWTYTYGYYVYSPEHAATQPAFETGKAFFEFLQGDAESSLERLHELAETRLHELTRAGASKAGPDTVAAAATTTAAAATGATASVVGSFQEFRKTLIGLTDVTRQYFDKLVAQLEKGLGGLADQYAADNGAQGTLPGAGGEATVAGASGSGVSSSSAGNDAAGGGGGGSGSAPLVASAVGRRSKRSRPGAPGGATAVAASGPQQQDPGGDGGVPGVWSCPHCTYFNLDASSETCEVCGGVRM